MAHCPYEKLGDLENVLDTVRKWDGIKERFPGVFYLKSRPFLHFHLQGARRWADVRAGKDWGNPLEIPVSSSELLRKSFLLEIRARYERLSSN